MKEMDYDHVPEGSMQMGMNMEQEPKQNPIDMLKQDHRKVEGLFQQFESEEDKKVKFQIAQQVCLELTVHALLEEELVYPLLRREDEDVEEEAFTEHELIKFMIGEIKPLGAREKSLDPKMKVLKELVEHHVKEEEEEALPELEGNAELEAMSDQMIKRKQQLLDKEMKRGLRGNGGGKKVAARSSSSGRKAASTSNKGGSSVKKAAAGKRGGMSKPKVTAKKASSTKKATASTRKSTGSTKKSTSGRGTSGARKSTAASSSKKKTTSRSR